MTRPKLKHEKVPVDNGVPLPAPRGRSSKYNLAELEIGQSKFFKKKQADLSPVVSYWQRKLKRLFATRTEGDGTRIWRTK
jgi:hypothetical protein